MTNSGPSHNSSESRMDGNLSVPSILNRFSEDAILSQSEIKAGLSYLEEHPEAVKNHRHAIYKYLTPDTSDWIWFKDEFTDTQNQWKLQEQYQQVSKKVLSLLRQQDLEDNRDIMLLVCTFYLYEYPWSTNETTEIAESILASFGSLPEDSFDTLMRSVVTEFRSAKIHKKVTESGRARDFVSTKKGLANRSEDNLNPEWRKRLYFLGTLRYVVIHGSVPLIQQHWHFIMPSILNIIDDHDVTVKAEGCRLLDLLLHRLEGTDLIQRTGVLPLFWSSVKTCLLYLPPSVKPALSAGIISQAFPVLVKLSLLEPTREKRNMCLDEVLREGLLKGMAQAGENLQLGNLLMTQLSSLIESLDVGIIRHLKPLVVVFSSVLCDPFASAYQPYLVKTLTVLQQLIQMTKPRIYEYRLDLLRCFVTCYVTLHKEQESAITAVTDAKLRECVGALNNALESHQDQFNLELKALIANNSALEPLLTVRCN